MVLYGLFGILSCVNAGGHPGTEVNKATGGQFKTSIT